MRLTVLGLLGAAVVAAVILAGVALVGDDAPAGDGIRAASAPEVCDGIPAAPPPTVQLVDLTWPEVCAALAAGFTTVLVPSAGIEQNGEHLVLGKHRYVVTATSVAIAEALGDALVAPVIDHQDEGRIDPPYGHMAFPGTISVPDDVYAAILEATAQSLRQHGFEHIALVGDSGSNQAAQERVADDLAGRWGAGAVLAVSDYYDANGQVEWLEAEGETLETIGTHAGIRETSELLASHPDGVRVDELRDDADPASGSDGDPSRATAARGRKLLRLKVDAAVAQIRAER